MIGENGLAGLRLAREPVDGLTEDNMFSDLMPSTSTSNPYTAPTYTQTPVSSVPSYNPYTSAPVTGGAADWNLYLQNNPDVAQAYATVSHSQFPTAASYAQWHYQHYGATEGRAYPTPVAQPAQPAPTPATPAPTTPATPVVTSPTPAPETPAAPASPFATPQLTNTTTTGLSTPAQPSVMDVFANTPLYQFDRQQGLDAINSNAYARGNGNSGDTLKRLNNYGSNYALNGFQNYLGDVGSVAGSGAAAAGALNGVSQNYANASNAITQNGANAISNNYMYGAQQTGNMVNGIVNGIGTIAGSGIFGSSVNPAGGASPSSVIIGGGTNNYFNSHPIGGTLY